MPWNKLSFLFFSLGHDKIVELLIENGADVNAAEYESMCIHTFLTN